MLASPSPTFPVHASSSGSALAQDCSIRCKFTLDGQTRCLLLDAPGANCESTLHELRSAAARLFSIEPERSFQLVHQDSEDDPVTFDTAEELHAAMASHLKSSADSFRLVVQLPKTNKCSGRRMHAHRRHQLSPEQLEASLADLEKQGLGRRPKRNIRLLSKMGGDVAAVAALLRESDAAAIARKNARQQRRSAHAEVRSGERREARKARKKDSIAAEGFVSLSEGWPEDVKCLYLDGNNMLFLSSALRKLTLSRGERWKAEAMLSSIAESFAQAITSLTNTVVIYDSIHRHQCKTSTLENGARFTVASARPDFSTSDDALVAWAKALPPAQVKASLFVTSDRELKNRLLEVGALVTKPKQWMQLAMKTLRPASDRNSMELQEPKPHEDADAQDDPTRPAEQEGHAEEDSLDGFLEEWSAKLVLTSSAH